MNVNLRFQARVDGNTLCARKFNFKDFPTSDGCKQAAIAYTKKTSQLLMDFDAKRGKAIIHIWYVFDIYIYIFIFTYIHILFETIYYIHRYIYILFIYFIYIYNSYREI